MDEYVKVMLRLRRALAKADDELAALARTGDWRMQVACENTRSAIRRLVRNRFDRLDRKAAA